MNANEVIANLALEHLGLDRGRYDVIHPIDHVNRCQSTNDVYPTAIKLALVLALDDLLGPTARYLRTRLPSEGGLLRPSRKLAAPSCRTQCP